jgi:hypothetical protein
MMDMKNSFESLLNSDLSSYVEFEQRLLLVE